MTEEPTLTPLTPVEAIRARPGMYIGQPGPAAYWELVRLVLDYCVGTDGPIPCGATRVAIALLSDGGIDITGNGRGLPLTPSGQPGREEEPWATLAFTTVWAGAGFPGSGLAIVNAASSLLIASGDEGQRMWNVRFEEGEQDGPIAHGTVVGCKEPHSSSIAFWPRTEIVGALDRADFDARLGEYAAAHPHIEFTVTDYDPAGLDAAIARTTRAIVRPVGPSGDGDRVWAGFDVTTPADVAELRRRLAVEAVGDGYCMCSGQLSVQFLDEAGEELALVTVHHAQHVRWAGWSGDGFLADGGRWLAWLAARGVPPAAVG